MGTGGPCRGPEPVSRKVPGRCRERHSREFFCAVTRRLGGCAAHVADFFAIFITRTEPLDDRLGRLSRLGRLERAVRADLLWEVLNPMTPDSAGRGWKWPEVRGLDVPGMAGRGCGRRCREWPAGDEAECAGNGWQGSPRMAFASDEAGSCPGVEASAGDSSRAAPDAFAGGGVWASTPFFRRVPFDGNPRGTNR